MRTRLSTLCGVSFLCLVSSPAWAQSTPEASPAAGAADAAPQASDADGPQLADIVVTAQRREESVSKVPISITVVGGEALKARAISNLQDITLTIPNFQITQTGLATQTFIRGIGTGNDPAFEQSVAQYVDGVSYGRAQLTRTPFFDVGRIEVLRGPQSILFGKNSTAGAVSIVSALPTSALAAGVTTTYTPEFNQTETTAFVSGPIADGLTARAAVRYLNEKGYVRNTTLDRTEPRRDEFAARGTIRYDGGGVRLTLKGEYSKFNLFGRDIEVIHDIATRTITTGALAGQPLTYANSLTLRGAAGALVDTNFNDRRQANTPDTDRTRLYNATLTTEFDVGASTLTSVTSFVDYERGYLGDLDFTGANILAGLTDERYRQASQELRIVTPASAPLSFTGGLYYEYNRLAYDDGASFGPDTGKVVAPPAPASLAALAFLAGTEGTRNYRQRSDSYAAFGQLTWRIADRLRLIGGARVTLDDKHGTRVLVARTGSNDFNAPLVTSPLIIAVYQGGIRYALNNPGGAGHNLRGYRSRTRFVPSATVEFDLAPDALLFGSYKEGYKGGGFNARSNSNANFEFDDEFVKQWEGGFRARFAQNRGSFGVTGYRATYSNLQVSQFDGTVGFNVTNAGRSRAQGVEADARFAVARGITLGASASYLDFKYLDFRRGQCAFGQTPNGDVVNGVALCDYTGLRGRFTPKWNLTGSLGVDRGLTDTLRLRGSLDVSYKSAHNINDTLDALGYIDGYTIVDARLGVGGKNWDVTAIGRNLLNERFPTYSANVPFASFVGANTQYATVSRPRSVAVQLSLRY